MNDKYVLTVKKWLYPGKGEYIKYYFQEADTFNTYKIFHFVTQAGEAGILNCLSEIPEGVESITKIYDSIIEEYDIPFHMINSLRQDAWRYFADKSRKGFLWHLNQMTGTPYKNNLTDEESLKMQLLEEDTIVAKTQMVTHKKWLNLSEKDQIKHIRLFLDNPVKGSDYILKNTFHQTDERKV